MTTFLERLSNLCNSRCFRCCKYSCQFCYSHLFIDESEDFSSAHDFSSDSEYNENTNQNINQNINIQPKVMNKINYSFENINDKFPGVVHKIVEKKIYCDDKSNHNNSSNNNSSNNNSVNNNSSNDSSSNEKPSDDNDDNDEDFVIV